MDKISYAELMRQLRDEDIDETSLRQYFTELPDQSAAFAPAIGIDPKRVEMDSDLEGDIAVGAFNWLCKRKRQKRYRRKIESGNYTVKIVEEGDSWHQYPILLNDIVDQLFNDYAIYSLSGAGHLLEDMLEEDEITDALRREKPDLLLLSGTGNDMVGDGPIGNNG